MQGTPTPEDLKATSYDVDEQQWSLYWRRDSVGITGITLYHSPCGFDVMWFNSGIGMGVIKAAKEEHMCPNLEDEQNNPLITVYITIGNSDDKLAQYEWAKFFNDMEYFFRKTAIQVFAITHSLPNSEYQNAVFCGTFRKVFYDATNIGNGRPMANYIRDRLAAEAKEFKQDSIAMIVVPSEQVELVKPA